MGDIRMTFPSLSGKRIADDSPVAAATSVGEGAWFWVTDKDGNRISIVMIVPGDGYVRCIDVDLEKRPSKWQWDGNVEAPTLKPSIRAWHGIREKEIWHGFFRAGNFVGAD